MSVLYWLAGVLLFGAAFAAASDDPVTPTAPPATEVAPPATAAAPPPTLGPWPCKQYNSQDGSVRGRIRGVPVEPGDRC